MTPTQWSNRIDAMIATIECLTPDQFFDQQTLRYHAIETEISALVEAFTPRREKLHAALATNPSARACWLPIDPDAIRAMSVDEVHWRLAQNWADERFVDGALEEAFQSGSLVAALKRIRGGLGELSGAEASR